MHFYNKQKIILDIINKRQEIEINKQTIKQIINKHKYKLTQKIMKDFTQDNRLSAIEQDDIQSFNRTKFNTNTDIQYLLTFVQLKQGARQQQQQQQQLILNKKGRQQHNKQEQKKRILDQQTIHRYIEENSSRESQSYQDRVNLISFIDMGLRIINRVKAVMTRKKQQIKNGITKPNKLGLIKQLFFPGNNNSKVNVNVNGSSVNSNSNNINARQQQQQQQMDKLRVQQQLCMLLHKVQTDRIQTKKETAHYRYLLSISMYEQLQQKSASTKSINSIQQRQVIVELINKLQLELSKLQIVVSGRNRVDESQIQQKMNLQLQTVWGVVGQLASVLN